MSGDRSSHAADASCDDTQAVANTNLTRFKDTKYLYQYWELKATDSASELWTYKSTWDIMDALDIADLTEIHFLVVKTVNCAIL